MKEIKITEKVTIYNDMPRGWIQGKGQPRWHKKVYNMWRNRWDKCRNPNNPSYEYYKDCEIDEDFKYLSNFVKWIMNQPLFEEFVQTCNKVKWVIDKDMKDSNNRNYYPEYMTLTTQSENSKEMLNRRGNPNPKTPVIAIDTHSNKVLLFKSTHDAQDKGFHHSDISKCINKLPHHKSHKGYKWYRINYKHNKTYRRV